MFWLVVRVANVGFVVIGMMRMGMVVVMFNGVSWVVLTMGGAMFVFSSLFLMVVMMVGVRTLMCMMNMALRRNTVL